MLGEGEMGLQGLQENRGPLMGQQFQNMRPWICNRDIAGGPLQEGCYKGQGQRKAESRSGHKVRLHWFLHCTNVRLPWLARQKPSFLFVLLGRSSPSLLLWWWSRSSLLRIMGRYRRMLWLWLVLCSSHGWFIFQCAVFFVCDGVSESCFIGMVSGFPWLQYSLICEWCHKFYFQGVIWCWGGRS